MTDGITPALRANLAAIQRRDPQLADRLCLSVGSDHVRQGQDGSNYYRIHRSWHPIDLSDDAVAQSLADLDAQHVFLFGLGLGEQLLALLAGSAESIIAWDRDPWMFRLVLSAHDLSRDIRKGRLRLALGADLLDVMEDSIPRDALLHPFFADRYRLELGLLQEGLKDRRALVVDGTLFVDDVAEALHQEGYSCLTWEVSRLAPEELAHTAKRFGAQVAVEINYTQGLADACRTLGLKLLTWEIDPATDKPRPCRPPAEHAHIFSYRRAQLPIYEEAGFPNARYLPLAANPTRRHPVELSGAEEAQYQAPVAFVGASMVEQASQFRDRFIAEYCLWRGGSPTEARAHCEVVLEALVTAHRDDLTRCHVPQLLNDTLPEFVAALQSKPGKPDPVVLASELIAADKRMLYVANLGQLGVHVWGDENWSRLAEHGAVYRGSAGHRFELNKVYCGATVNVDIGRIYQSDMVTMRVFDVLACGGFILAERNEELLELFEEGVELECYTDLQELLEKAEHYSANPDQAAAIAARGRQAVLERHTIAGRVAEMLEAIEG